MFGSILLAFLLQMLFTLGMIVLFGWVIALINRRFYMNFGEHARTVCYVTGFFGTPVHELSHALFCVIFGHKIREIKLFQISDDGTLGYVSHSYNKSNFYQNLGNFFIGIAPIVGISAVLYLASYILLPPFTADISGLSEAFSLNDFGAFFSGLWGATVTFFSLILSWQWWLFLLISILLALHMTLSKADMNGAMSGLIFYLAAFFAVDVALGYIDAELLQAFTRGVLSVACYLLCFLLLALFITLVALGISFIFKLVHERNKPNAKADTKPTNKKDA